MTSLRRLLLVQRWAAAALAVLWCVPLLLRPAGNAAAAVFFCGAAGAAAAAVSGGILKGGAACSCPMDTSHTGKPCCCHTGHTAAERLAAYRASCGTAFPGAATIAPELTWKAATAPVPSIPAPGTRALDRVPSAGVLAALVSRALPPLGPPPRLLVS